MTLAELFSGLRKRRLDRAADQHLGYVDLLRSVAAGEQIDVDELAIVLDGCGKSESDLAGDVEVFKRRLRWAEQLAAAPKAERESASLTAEIEARDRKLNEYIALERQALRDMIDRRNLLDATRMGATSAAARLRESCLDPALQQRESDLRQRQREIGQRLSEINDQLADNGSGGIPGELDFARQNLRKWEATKPAGSEHSRQYIQTARTEFGQRVARYEELLRDLQQRRSDTAAELAAINRELQRIEDAKLVP